MISRWRTGATAAAVAVCAPLALLGAPTAVQVVAGVIGAAGVVLGNQLDQRDADGRNGQRAQRWQRADEERAKDQRARQMALAAPSTTIAATHAEGRPAWIPELPITRVPRFGENPAPRVTASCSTC